MNKPSNIVWGIALIFFLSWFFLGKGWYVAAAILYIIAVLLITQPPNFAAYETTMDLNGAVVKDVKLSYTRMELGSKVYYYTQTYSSGVTLSQSKFDRWRPEDCSSYNAQIFTEDKTECHHYQLKGDDAYRVVIRRSEGEIVSFFISAKLGGTDVHLRIPPDQYDEFVGYEEWEHYFRSMKKRTLLFMPSEEYISPLRAAG